MSQSPLNFRDQLPSITQDGNKRQWMYPKLIKGKLYRYRSAVSYFFLGLLFAAPFLKLNGEQLVLLNVLERKFVFFGVIFWPQDFYLFVLALLTFMVFIVLFTVVFGRVFCGWACPQTIFMEMVFRKIETWIEGDSKKQKLLDQAPMSAEKFFKKLIKHFLFLTISFLIANIFLSYLIGSDTLLKIITEPVSQHISGFIAISVFTFVFYLVFSRMRELVCTVACPYGRLQGVLLDNKTILVAYDYQRGEPRGKINKAEQSAKGDCTDCGLCVQVCPTGIDIRNGTQLECVNCTACIDACDMVMEKTGRPLRLIGFKSEDEIASATPFKLNRRIYAYAAVLFVLTTVLSVLLFSRSDIKTTILRAGGTLYQLREKEAEVSNLYNVEMVNKTTRAIDFKLKADDPAIRIQYIQQETKIGPGASTRMTFFVIMPQNHVNSYKSKITFSLMAEGKTADRFETTFIAPIND
ncbi:cytochrome c oxidase accessory protein CcoG [Pedobacter antarcticus]|uniref:cytochrome c oxidase accessory protein CcoG n=1 Tax=Pedobacter antarcticus TaxID=34086 RepID=UPI001C59C02A|nr:cytochrome c oxidase accessory protein CcoG [Pedobacter antarcticus]